ncbi:MAG: heparan-alpha-glucosaminide N-acetyltransferase domain-containing protein [Myxococcaceae bacterium]
MAEKAGRIYAFDWLRGVAVLVMIQTHCVPLLLPALQTGEGYWRLVGIDGLVAPSFIFSAGFALALVQVRAGLAGKRGEAAKKSARRIAEVFAVATLINFIWFPMWREPKWIFRIDILHCIAISLGLLLPVLYLLATRPLLLRWVTLGLALAVFCVSPLGESVTGWPSLFLNVNFGVLDETTGAAFPLLPWAGYVFLGASFGATVASGTERSLWAWLGLLLGLGAVLWFFDRQIEALYPPHHFWVTNPANAASRWTRVLALVAVFRLIERRWPASAQTRFFKWLAAFGGASLSAYFFHLMWLYERHVNLFVRWWRGQADWPTFWVLVAALIALTWVTIQAWDKLEPRLRKLGARPTSAAPLPPAS